MDHNNEVLTLRAGLAVEENAAAFGALHVGWLLTMCWICVQIWHPDAVRRAAGVARPMEETIKDWGNFLKSRARRKDMPVLFVAAFAPVDASAGA